MTIEGVGISKSLISIANRDKVYELTSAYTRMQSIYCSLVGHTSHTQFSAQSKHFWSRARMGLQMQESGTRSSMAIGHVMAIGHLMGTSARYRTQAYARKTAMKRSERARMRGRRPNVLSMPTPHPRAKRIEIDGGGCTSARNASLGEAGTYQASLHRPRVGMDSVRPRA